MANLVVHVQMVLHLLLCVLCSYHIRELSEAEKATKVHFVCINAHTSFICKVLSFEGL